MFNISTRRGTISAHGTSKPVRFATCTLNSITTRGSCLNVRRTYQTVIIGFLNGPLTQHHTEVPKYRRKLLTKITHINSLHSLTLNTPYISCAQNNILTELPFTITYNATLSQFQLDTPLFTSRDIISTVYINKHRYIIFIHVSMLI